MELYHRIYRITLGHPEKLTPLSVRRIHHKEDQLNQFSQKKLHFDEHEIKTKVHKTGFSIQIPMREAENIYGFGLQLKQFNHKRKKVTVRNNADPKSTSGDTHAPIPFYLSSDGYGVFVDTARNASFYCGHMRDKGAHAHDYLERRENLVYTEQDFYRDGNDDDKRYMLIEIPVVQGADLYVIEGNNLMEVVQKYNLFSGGGPKVPDWGLGVWYRTYGGASCNQILKTAQNFKDKEIPLDVLGIEPGWQTYSYSCSYIWDEGKRMQGYEEMLKQLQDMDVKVNLWEHAYVHPSAEFYQQILPFSGDYEVWEGAVPDFATKEARKIFADYHKKIIEQGVSGFKLDECDNSDFAGGWAFPMMAEFPSGLDGEQMHNLLGVLYQETMQEALEGKETYGAVRASHLFATSLPYVLYSDLYDHEDFIRGIVNSGFSGILWTPELRHADSDKDLIRRLQTVVLSAQALINGWYIENPPWESAENPEEMTRIVKRWLTLRKEFLPYLREIFDRYETEGIPPFRALVLDFPEDRNTYDIDDEYMFGDKYLVAPLTAKSDTRKVYLPNGTWRCFFTGKEYEGGSYEMTYPIDQLPFFEKIK